MLQVILNTLRDHGIKLLLAPIFGLVGWWIGHRRAQAKWRRRDFLDRLNISLNIIQDGRLQLRTLLEKSCEDVFLNSAAVEAILTAAKKTTAENPLLPLPQDDCWYFLNAVLNEVSEQFAEGLIKRDLGVPVTRGQYLLCLTYESAGELKTRKIRALMIRHELLLNLPKEPPQFDSPHHITRWQTLQRMQAAYQISPQQFIKVEICV